MKKYLAASLASLAILQFGCAPQGHNNAGAVPVDQGNISENDLRLHNLEDRITALNEQVSQLNNRVYEVRTRNGQKTSMTVVPVTPQTPAQNAANVQASNQAFEASQTGLAPAQTANVARSQPVGRKINPTSKPSPIPKKQPATQTAAKTNAKPQPNRSAGASGSVGQSEIVAGPQGQIAATPADNLSLPPAELPPAVVQAANPSHVETPNAPGVSAASNYRGSVQHEGATPPIPVPVLPETGLALPPETPGAATTQVSQASVQAPAAVPVQPAQTPKQTASTLPRGETNAYNAALKAVRSGRTNEGIRLFRDFLQRYPNGKYAANADYWIGECLYQQGKYQDALSQFNTVNNSFPKHHKNADALLKAGLTMNKMGDNAGANEKFRSILINFPNSEAARRVKAMGIR